MRHDAHIRIDVFYTHMSPRGKAAINVGGFFLVFLPVMLLFVVVSFARMWQAWITGEVSIETFWYPPIAPFRTVVAIGFTLLFTQGVASFIRNLYLLIRNKSYD